MKKILFSLVMSMAVWAVAQAQTLHTVIVTNYQFVPAVLNVQVGDTVNFSCTLGCHDVNGSQTTFPGNPASFGNSTACATWDYTVVITLPGTYQYQSDADIASGMQGTIIATNPVVIGGPFTPGNIVIARVGDGVAPLSTAAQAVFLDEYSASGAGLSLVQTVLLPIAANGSNAPFATSGTSTSEGALQLSADGTKLVMAGYAVTPGTANTQTFGASNRVIALINANGTIDTKTGITTGTGYTNMSLRGAATVDGSVFWGSGGATGGGGATGASGGTRYLAAGSVTSTSTQLSTTAINTRGIGIFDGQLYAAGTVGTVSTVYSIGTGLPTTAGQTTTPLPGFPTTTGGGNAPTYGSFQFVNMSDTVANSDVLYVVDARSAQTGGGVQKWSKVNNVWKQNSRITFAGGTVANITVRKVCDAVYVIGTSANSLVYVIDTAGYNKKPSDTVFVVAATAPTNTAFRGVSLTPNTLQSTTPLSVATTTTDATCGQADGSATVNVTGGAGTTYMYQWNTAPGQNTPQASNIGVGTYTVIVADGLGCTKTATVTVNAQAVTVPLTNTIVPPVCHGASTGSATVAITNPTSTYTYAWSNGATGATASNLAPGTYYITISDANGCIQRDTVTLSNPPSINLSLFPSPAIGGFGASNGAVATTITGGVPPYQFVWTGGATTQNLTNIPAGSYVVSVSDANGCTASAITTVSQINGTSDIANVNSFTAYPNPTNGHYFINLELIAADNVSVSVYDINGRLVAERRSLNAKTVQLDLDLSNEAAGVYSAKIMVGDRLLQVAKIVKMTGE